jgi:high-affinity iron transporter
MDGVLFICNTCIPGMFILQHNTKKSTGLCAYIHIDRYPIRVYYKYLVANRLQQTKKLKEQKEVVETLLSSAFIIFREGFETWLIAILALASTTNKNSIKTIWIAIIASFLATISLGSITAQFLGSHANIERFEGVIGVITGGLLAYVAWICHGASQHVKELPYNNSVLLGLAVFGVMFREGVEVIVFLTGIISQSQSLQMVILGSLVGLVLLVITAILSNKQIKKLPIKHIFKISRWIFSILAVYFLYNGVHEIMEHGLLPL